MPFTGCARPIPVASPGGPGGEWVAINWKAKLCVMTWRARRLQPEVMDQPGLDPAAHRHALAGLARLNRLSRSSALLWSHVAEEARTLRRPLRVLDLASGGGDVAIALARRAARAKIDLEIHGHDMSELAIDLATQQAQREGFDRLCFTVRDVLRQPAPQRYDVVMSSLFLHHLTEGDALLLLQRMAEATASLVLLNDLRRTRFGKPLIWLASRLVTRSKVVHVDGPLSAQAAFTVGELAAMARQAGLADCTITAHFPQRMLLRWKRTPAPSPSGRGLG